MSVQPTMTRYRTLAVVLGAVTVAACGDKTTQLSNITAPPIAGAFVQFFNFSVGAPQVNFYAGALKVTGVSSSNCAPPNDTTSVCLTTGNESTTGTAYGGVANAGFFAQVAPGAVALSAKITATTNNGVAVATTNATLAAGTSYSYYMSGIFNAGTNASDAFVIADTLPAVNLDTVYVRFVNAISNASNTLALSVKLESSGTVTAVGAAQAYQTAGAYTVLPAGLYDLTVQATGASSALVTRTAVSFVAGHVYTVTARGDPTSGVTANKPALDNTANR